MAPTEIALAELDLARWVRPGDGVVWSQHCAEPVGLVDALLATSREVAGIRAFSGLTWRDVLSRGDDGLELWSYGALGQLRRAAVRRPIHIVPCHLSALPSLFARRALPGDVAMVQVAPPDERGRCSFGIGVDYLADAAASARIVIAEVNDRMPRTRGVWLDYDAIDVVVPTSRPLLEAPTAAESEVEQRIADHIVELVRDGDTIQTGVGGLPAAILRRLDGRRDLAIHSGMIGDAVIDLLERGVITGARKSQDPGLVVTGAGVGTQRLFDFLDDEPRILFRPVSYTHSPSVLARVGPLVAINGALEVDLRGQVNAEQVNGRHLGAVGGQVDFLRAATATGGTGIVALPSVVAGTGDSRIVSALSGPVTTTRSDVDVVVTEHGVASLRDLSIAERAAALVAIAAPEHREKLARMSSTVLEVGPPRSRHVITR